MGTKSPRDRVRYGGGARREERHGCGVRIHDAADFGRISKVLFQHERVLTVGLRRLRPNDLGCEQERPDHTLVQQHGDLALVSSASLSILQLKGLVLDLAHTEAQISSRKESGTI